MPGARQAAVQAALANRGSQEDNIPMSSRRATVTENPVPAPSSAGDESGSADAPSTPGKLPLQVHVYIKHMLTMINSE